MSNINDEKERLMQEILGRKRAYEKDNGDEDIELSFQEGEKKTSSPSSSILKSASDAMNELNQILLKQKKDLESLSSRVNNTTTNMSQQTLDDLALLEKQIEQDYGIKAETVVEPKKQINTTQVFTDVQKYLEDTVLGQKEAVKQLTIAFRRPFVMGYDATKPRNVMLISGPKGSGKHAAVTEMTSKLSENRVLDSKDVYTIDMSRYTSASQEQIFLQDLYEALSGKGDVICFENFETSFPSFTRMLNSLIVDGKIVLNKRYVLSQGVLVENQTGLVKDAVDSLSADGKYLVFITNGKASKVQDVFGANFIYHVLDQIEFVTLDDESISRIITRQTEEFTQKAENQLHVTLHVSENVRSWVHTHFDKTQGAESITSIFYDFYVSLSQLVLNEGLGNQEIVDVTVVDEVPVAQYQQHSIRLSRVKNNAEEVELINKEIDQIVGLHEVKDYIRSLQSHIAIQQKRKEQGMKTASLSKHMIFTGNPGTGKTTIARLISRYMKAIGALSEGQLVEVTRADLVAQYVGQTAPLTMSVIKSAIGGVLFIDEAYSLYRGKDDSFGLEAIDTLVKAMEDQRDNLIVILAGYEKEMASFLVSNSGLKSRFPNLIHFPDYTGEELRKIAVIQASSKGYEIEEDVLQPLEDYFTKVQSINAMEAGNGRLARNLIEDAILKQANRLVSNPDDDITKLKKEDFDFTVKVTPPEQNDSAISLEEMLQSLNKQ